MAANRSTETQEDDSSRPPNNILSMLPKIQLNLPFLNKKPNTLTDSPKTPVDTEIENHTSKPNSVRFVESPAPIIPPPLELEAEEPAGRTSNPIVLWQVYALGGFLVLRWVWARWKERKERSAKKESSDDNEASAPSPADDDNYHSA